MDTSDNPGGSVSGRPGTAPDLELRRQGQPRTHFISGWSGLAPAGRSAGGDLYPGWSSVPVAPVELRVGAGEALFGRRAPRVLTGPRGTEVGCLFSGGRTRRRGSSGRTLKLSFALRAGERPVSSETHQPQALSSVQPRPGRPRHSTNIYVAGDYDERLSRERAGGDRPFLMKRRTGTSPFLR